METTQPPEFIKLLAHDLRWSLVKALTQSDWQVNELVAQLNQPMNLISYHLKKMRKDSLVTPRRSEADGRDIYYSLNIHRLQKMYHEAGLALHPAMALNPSLIDVAHFKQQTILFVCTHNSARSQMAEGLLRHLTQGHLTVFSAGSHPTHIHPDAIRAMDHLGINIRDQQPQSLTDFEGQSFDYVITVCDKAREVCPTFTGLGTSIHWSFPDPSTIKNETERQHQFAQTAEQLKSRIEYFLASLANAERGIA